MPAVGCTVWAATVLAEQVPEGLQGPGDHRAPVVDNSFLLHLQSFSGITCFQNPEREGSAQHVEVIARLEK